MCQDFTTLAEFAGILRNLPGPDEAAGAAAAARNAQLTKPPAALGRLEDLAQWYCSWRGDPQPRINHPQVIIFAGNHGVTARGVSAFPAEVTAQMVENFRHGGAAINQLAQIFGARMDVHALSLETPTADFTTGPAMDEEAVIDALRTGWNAVDAECDLLVTGEMGIGNTTSAAAIALALFGGDAQDWTGAGTGLGADGIALKSRIVAEGVAFNRSAQRNGLEALRCLGGRELAAMAGAITRARVMRIPVILDGFICSAAAACLQAVDASALDHVVAGHQSAEAAHAALLDKMGKTPLLALEMRLGEGSGAALAISILQGAIACHSGMATFAEAGVTDG
ncbi:nicotinate-nucleotide--dimethylbenzimidazole phosphoribosyltransferase [uncultured Roseovarius sp.]|uniref:nicotinate-nucleotide--dimethylbenzimidazole phosphoribosyltransferase n=1 Tax=uncultured Roseovarius sp. TaxID=293344 RepID=UPI00260C31FE|nr:nicotinate-nucleotide--dimethylbenzimidazole phosphoribosyltransferase [uncultured Roseovarius sp.]